MSGSRQNQSQSSRFPAFFSFGLRFACALAAASSVGCSGPTADSSDGSEDAIGETSFTDAQSYWRADADIDAWWALTQKLDAEFDQVCGDTFCGGDYSNLTSLSFNCSVTSIRGSLRECIWVFAGSSHLVDASTGTVRSSIASFQCRVPLRTSARALLTHLGAPGSVPSIRRILPDTTFSLYDVLAGCFQNPIDATPMATSPGTGYVDAIDSYNAGTDVDRYFAAERTLKTEFDNVCGDTFCEGDYPNLRALRLACSVRASTGALRDCKWLFAGSYTSIDPTTGTISVNAKSYRCRLPMSGTANELSSVLTSTTEKAAPLERLLPGSTQSAYDVLMNCL